MNRLVYLDLTDNGLKDNLAAELFVAVAQSRTLKYLTYAQNELGLQTASELGQLLM
jgi:Ran GTPase-activating protein (RanGAP) involved in mRNA processing and transport